MKKLLLIIVSIIAFGCSNDDNPDPVVPATYSFNNNEGQYKIISLASVCDGQPISYCISDEDYQMLYEQFLNSDGNCYTVTVNDIDGVERSGYVEGLGSGGVCLRDTNP